MNFTQDKYSAPMAIEKIKILGAVLELPAKQHCWFGRFGPVLRKTDWIGSAVQLVSPKQLPGFSFFFFICPGCRIFILCEIHCYFCPHIFGVYYFSISQCAHNLFYCILNVCFYRKRTRPRLSPGCLARSGFDSLFSNPKGQMDGKSGVYRTRSRVHQHQSPWCHRLFLKSILKVLLKQFLRQIHF